MTFMLLTAAGRLPAQDDGAKAHKDIAMAATVDAMATWQSYPTYEVYLQLMQRYAARHPQLCYLDTMGFSAEGRLLLALAIGDSTRHRSVMLTGTLHGDELLPAVLLLRMADSLTASYGTEPAITALIDSSFIVINPIANPDGLYRGGNHTVAAAWRYNAGGVDLNRNFPDPFGYPAPDSLQPETRAQMRYAARHSFSLAASLHSGDEVVNLPWDSFSARQRRADHYEWWQQVAQRMVATVRGYDEHRLRSVNTAGYAVGGDWMVVHNGRQDYMNYYHSTLELTLEVSSYKQLPSERLPHYWHCYAQALIDFMGEPLPPSASVAEPPAAANPMVFPNPTRGIVTISAGHATMTIDLSARPTGVYCVGFGGNVVRVVKQ